MTPEIAQRIGGDPALRELFQIGHRRKVTRGRVVLSAGACAESLHLVLSGTVAVEAVDLRGNRILLSYLYPGDFFGEMGLFRDVDSRSANICARTDAMLLEISYRNFMDLTRKHPALWLELAGQLASRLRTVNRRLATRLSLQAADRLWLVLKELAERSDAPRVPEGSVVRMTREELGKLAGCARDVAGAALRQFEADGRLSRRGHSLIVRDRSGSVAAIRGADTASFPARAITLIELTGLEHPKGPRGAPRGPIRHYTESDRQS